jgi:ubiquinone/menaquinone biosynthesis C-methylase UbiE
VSFFDQAYEGTPPWDIGRPQEEFDRLEGEGEVRGRVLDVGCGTGENALLFAQRGHETWGVDFAPRAIRRAEEKSTVRGIPVRFVVASAFQLGSLGRSFDTVTDCGLFHTFSDEERPTYAASLASVLPVGGRLFVLCFSEREPDWGGPRRVTQEELRATFADGWAERWIRPARFGTVSSEIAGHAWLAAFERAEPALTRRRTRPGPRPSPRRRKQGTPSSARRTSRSR